jgi:DNA-binding NarL/FixJ family response regulator
VAEPIRLVLVDDEPDIRELLQLRLERDGGFVIVGQAADGPEAVDVCAETQPDVLLLDVAMPGGDGLDSVIDIRRASPQTIVIIYTSATGIKIRNEAEQVGAHAVVGKLDPFELLLGTIYRFLPDRAPADRTKEEREQFNQRMAELLDKDGDGAPGRTGRSKKSRVGMIAVLVLLVLPLLAFLAWLLGQLLGWGLSL